MASTALVVNGQISLLKPRAALVAAGAGFVVNNPTPGTAIAYANQTSYSATANGMFLVQNNNPVGGKNIILDQLELVQTATAPTGTLVARFEVVSETGIVAMTGNVATRTPLNLLSSSSAATLATVQSFAAGAATVPAAAGTRKILGVIAMDIGVSVIHDKWVLDFGGDATATAPLTAARATAAATIVTAAPQVVIGPQSSAWINSWTLTGATNVPSYEFSLRYFEI